MEIKPFYVTPSCLETAVEAEQILCGSLVESGSQIEYNEQFTESKVNW